MNAQTACIRPIKSAVLGFLGITMMVMAFGIAGKMGILETELAKRAIGLATGLMIAVIGNLLPKLRPLSWMRVGARSITTELLSGWILVLNGIIWIALFAFAPLNQARQLCAIFGIAALMVITANWVWLAQGALFRGRKANGEVAMPSKQTAEKRKLMGYLLFAFLYVIVTTCVKFLIAEKQLADKVTSWMFFSFNMSFAVLFAVFEYRHARNYRDSASCM